MDQSAWLWLGFITFILLLLAFDLGVLHRKSRVIGTREALWLSAGYMALALAFNAGVFAFLGPDKGLEFLTGYLIEKSLSLDNIFVIALIFGSLGVPAAYQHRVLFWGIIGALVMRAALIFAGVALIEAFHWIIYVFGAFLAVTGLKMLALADETPDPTKSRILKLAHRHLRITDGFESERFFVRRNGILFATPLFLALLLVETTDLIFAIDSIPAVFAVTTDPFIVYTSNVFAILGLRALYFALSGILPRFIYLKHGLALVLVLVGVKMLLADVWKMPTALALALTLTILAGSIFLSIRRTSGASGRIARGDL